MTKIIFSERHTKPMPYYLGLDIGTNSIGWAVSDENYSIIKKGKKSLWGVRRFSEAKTAVERRTFRTARRRKKRLKKRIALLQEYFADEISLKDQGFYQRMKDSFFYEEDKTVAQRFSLFNDPSFTDKDYYEAYPTIYHLRKELMDNNNEHDVRLVYLACHHIMKHRGHFLWEGTEFSLGQQIDKELMNLNNAFVEVFGFQLWEERNFKEIRTILSDANVKASDKARRLQAFLSKSTKQCKEFCKLIVGKEVEIDILFALEDYDEDLKSIEFSNANYETEKQEEALRILGDDGNILNIAYGVYTAALLEQLLRDERGNLYSSLSEARIAKYDKHKKDLADLKRLIRKLREIIPSSKSAYREIFRENREKLNNYVAYSGKVDSRDSSSPHQRCNHEDFLEYLKKKLQDLQRTLSASGLNPDSEIFCQCSVEIERIIAEIGQGAFLPKITSSANGVIPHQLHEMELKAILESASNYLEFLTPKVIDEIIQLFKFRVPYYVGPFDDREEKSEFSWLVRRKNESIRPWNMDEVVDIAATSENFIRRMTNKCTYLIGEDVLPKESLLYSEFIARQHVNMLTIDGHRLDDDKREALFKEMFINNANSKLTRRKVLSCLRAIGINIEDASLGGMDQEIPVKLRAKKDFHNYLSEQILSEKEVEEIILKLTIFPDSDRLVQSWLRSKFAGKLSEGDIRKISKLRYAGWGNLSRKLLKGISHSAPDGNKHTIISYMREKPLLLMELLHSPEISFGKKIEEHNASGIEKRDEITGEYLDSLRLSPPVRKAVRQVLLLCKELFHILGGVPKRIFIEMARENVQDKKRTVSRKKQLEALYRDIRDDERLWKNVLDGFSEDKFKSKKLYLYATQLGKCMYSGEPIDIEDLFDNNKYDIDHIYPRSLTKDDSWDNLVLVKQELNRAKSDKEISSEIQQNQRGFWQTLRDSRLISEEKLKRLTRKDKLTPEELDGFLNRQLVETRQSTKAITDIFKRLLDETEIVFVKSRLVSDFRYRDGLDEKNKTKFYFPKIRLINDYHHAKDAYLNVVVGNAYHVKFTKKFYSRLYESGMQRQYNLNKFFDSEIKNGSEIAWVPGESGTIARVKQVMAQNDILITYKSHRSAGGFFDQMLMKKGSGQHPIKTSIPALANIDKYGGYNSVSGSHFCVVDHLKGRRRVKELVTLPIYLNKYNFSKESILAYLASQGFVEPKIICEEIKYWSIIEFNRCKYRLKGKNGDTFKCAPVLQAFYTQETESQIKEFERMQNKGDYSELDEEFALAFFEMLCCKLMNPPFSDYGTFINQARKLNESQDVFLQLSSEEKVTMLVNILEFLRGEGEPVDFSLVYRNAQGRPTGKKSGVFTLTVNNNRKKSLSLINQSISGFFENRKEIF